MVCSSNSQTIAAGPLAGIQCRPLQANEIHVWHVSVDSTPLNDTLKTLLSRDELEKARRFRFERDRNRFILGRGLLRVFLGRYLKTEPAKIYFSYNRYGKPFLPPDWLGERVEFNVSHSEQMIVLAFSENRKIGVDIEMLRPDFPLDDVSRQFFSEAEIAALGNLPEQHKMRAFFNCWTRKEAFIKGRGEGLSLPLDSFSVSLEPDAPAELLHTAFDAGEKERWTMHDLQLHSDFAAALVVEGRDAQVIVHPPM